jgi:hypothetical protein
VPSLILGATRDAAAQFTRHLFRIGYAVTQADERPRWIPGDFFGERFGMLRETQTRAAARKTGR